MPRKPKLPPGLWERDGVYYARFRAGGRLIRKRLSSDLRTACELLNDLKARADKADFGILDNDYSWPDLKAEFLKWGRQSLRPRVLADYEADLKRFESYTSIRNVRQISQDLAFGYREWRLSGGGSKQKGREGKPVTPRTVNREVGTISNMLNKAVEWKRIASNRLAGLQPLAHDTLSKERRALTAVEVQSLFKASPEHLKPVWRMFMCTGIRKGELVAMRFDDVDFERQSVIVRAATAKTGKAREIPLDDAMLTMLRSLQSGAKARKAVPGRTATLTAQQAKNLSRDHVFVTQANTPWRNNLLKRFYAICKRAGITDAKRGGSIDIHSLRVSFTTLALEHGANPKAIQAILGHSTLAMTMSIYAKATERSKREAIGVLPFAKVTAPEHVIPVQNEHPARTSSSDSSQPDVLRLLA